MLVERFRSWKENIGIMAKNFWQVCQKGGFISPEHHIEKKLFKKNILFSSFLGLCVIFLKFFDFDKWSSQGWQNCILRVQRKIFREIFFNAIFFLHQFGTLCWRIFVFTEKFLALSTKLHSMCQGEHFQSIAFERSCKNFRFSVLFMKFLGQWRKSSIDVQRNNSQEKFTEYIFFRLLSDFFFYFKRKNFFRNTKPAKISGKTFFKREKLTILISLGFWAKSFFTFSEKNRQNCRNYNIRILGRIRSENFLEKLHNVLTFFGLWTVKIGPLGKDLFRE